MRSAELDSGRAGVAGVAWRLERLMPDGAEGALATGRTALEGAQSFARRHRGQVAGYEAAELGAACAELERLTEQLEAAYAFAVLRFDADGEPPEHGALLSEIEVIAAEVETATTSFELEWLAVDDARAEALLAASALERYAHLLRVWRRRRPHRLSEAEERILTEKAVTGADAWRRLLSDQLAALEVELDGRELDLAEATAELSAPDRAARQTARDAISAALVPGLRTRTRIYNVLLADQAVDDRLRAYPSWLAALNLENQASDASVDALVEAVVARYDIQQRWARIKAGALGLERLADHDRLAPVAGALPEVSWEQARELVVGSYERFSPELGAIAARFFTEERIDAVLRPGKVPGAYCAPTTPDADPYVLLNFAGRLDDVLVLAHELGHGIHYVLSGPRGGLSLNAPVTLSETASVFGEMLCFAHLLERADDPGVRWALLAQQIDDTLATIFRQIAILRFEADVHAARREQGELSVEQLGERWLAASVELYGDTMTFSESYAAWWSQISHVYNTPGYVYGYAYGQLLAMAIYARYLEAGEAFVPSYLELLGAGGSRSPEALAAAVGVDLGDPELWSRGLGVLDQRIDEAEQALAEAGA